MDHPLAITGATGFLGRHLVLACATRGIPIRLLVRNPSRLNLPAHPAMTLVTGDLDQPEALVALLDGTRGAIHAAGTVSYDRRDRNLVWRTNVEGTQNLLDAARKVGLPRLVHISSTAAVGHAPQGKPIDETHPWNLGGMGMAYPESKRRAEEIVLAAAATGLDAVVVNPSNLIGPDDPGPSVGGKLILEAIHSKLPFILEGGRSFVDVRDVAEGTLLAFARGQTGERYLLSGENLTLGAFLLQLDHSLGRTERHLSLPYPPALGFSYLMDWFARLTGKRPRLSPPLVRSAHLYHYFSHAKATSILGWTRRPFTDTLSDTVTWFQSHP